MRASDLLSHEVRTADGRSLGRISDFRVVQDGPLVAGVQNAFRVDQFVVGRGGLAERLGYIRGRLSGPWLVGVIFRRLERRANLVSVADIDLWDGEKSVITLKSGAKIEHPA